MMQSIHAHIHPCMFMFMSWMPVGFLAGERANSLSKMQPEAAVQKFLDQLDETFGDSQQPRPASSAYVKAHIFDWAQEPYVGGAYSYPTLGAHDGDREALAAPVAGTVFFAGELGVWVGGGARPQSREKGMVCPHSAHGYCAAGYYHGHYLKMHTSCVAAFKNVCKQSAGCDPVQGAWDGRYCSCLQAVS
jgi:hypothetical protein